MNEQQEEQNLAVIKLAYDYIAIAFIMLENDCLFNKLCNHVSIHYDEYIEEINEEEYAERIVRLCNGR